jgi:AcrR family transcriptional regulator
MPPVDAPLTRDRILATAEDVIRRFGPAKATVVDVARALGVSHAAVYRHVATKAELRDLVVGRWAEATMPPLRTIAALPGPGPAATAAAVRRAHRRQTPPGRRRPGALRRVSNVGGRCPIRRGRPRRRVDRAGRDGHPLRCCGRYVPIRRSRGRGPGGPGCYVSLPPPGALRRVARSRRQRGLRRRVAAVDARPVFVNGDCGS